MKAQKARFTNILQIEDGFTLTEVMIAVGISAIITVSIVTTLGIASSSQANIEKTSEVDSLLEEIHGVLSDRGRCAQNLSGTAVAPTTDTHGSPLATGSIRQFDSAGVPGETVLALNAEAHGVTVTDIRLSSVAQLDGTHAAAKLLFTFQKPNVLGPSTVNRTIPLTVTTQAGLVTSCATGAAGTLNVGNDVCAISGGEEMAGMFYLNTSTGKCEEKPLTWFDGDEHTATCPKGYKIPPLGNEWDNCAWVEPPGYVYQGTCSTRKMADGTEAWMCSPTVVMSQDTVTNTCDSLYAKVVSPTGFKIQVRCMQDM